MPLTGSDLFCLSQGTKNGGDERCHWCNSACQKMWRHDDPGPRSFVKEPWRNVEVKNSNGLWMCLGCWMWRRRSVTIKFLDGTLADKCKVEDWGWFITPEYAWGLRKQDYRLLLEKLKSPPLTFALALKEQQPSKLQLFRVNEHERITGETRLSFTIDGIMQSWTPFELEDALAHDSNGKEFGTRYLAGLVPEEKPSLALVKGTNGKESGGRPMKEEEQLVKMKKVVRAK